MLHLGVNQPFIEKPGGDFPAQELLAFKPLGAVVVEAFPCSSQLFQRALVSLLGVVGKLAAVKIKDGIVDEAKSGD